MISRTGNSGLTLIEVLVSVAILSMGAVVVMQALARTAQAQALAEDRAQAYIVGASKMAEAELSTLAGTALPEHEDGHVRVSEQAFEWSINTVLEAEDPSLQLVMFAVTWQRGQYTYQQAVSTLVRLPQESP